MLDWANCYNVTESIQDARIDVRRGSIEAEQAIDDEFDLVAAALDLAVDDRRAAYFRDLAGSGGTDNGCST